MRAQNHRKVLGKDSVLVNLPDLSPDSKKTPGKVKVAPKDYLI